MRLPASLLYTKSLWMRKSNLRKFALYGCFVLLIIAFRSGFYIDIPVESLKPIYANEFSKFIEIDGMQVHYRVEGTGMPIVLLHGTGSSLHTWDDWTENLKENYRVIRMDLPAFGLTGPNKRGDYSIEGYTHFLDKFVSKTKRDSILLAGNSLGGHIAWKYTLQHSEKVKKLILVDASGLSTHKPQPWIFKMAKTPLLNTLFLYITPRYILKHNLQQVYEDDSKITEELVTRYHKMTLRAGNRGAFIDRAKSDIMQSESFKEDQLKSIQTPTLLLWGKNDQWIPVENGNRMNALMPNSELVVIPNSGHVPMEENPIESIQILNAFLNQKTEN